MTDMDKIIDACDTLIDFCSFQCVGCVAHETCLSIWAGHYESLFEMMDDLKDKLVKIYDTETL